MSSVRAYSAFSRHSQAEPTDQVFSAGDDDYDGDHDDDDDHDENTQYVLHISPDVRVSLDKSLLHNHATLTPFSCPIFVCLPFILVVV